MHANCSTSLPFHHQQMEHAHTLIDWQTWQPAKGYQVISLPGEDTQMSRQDDWYHTHLEQKSSQVCYYERHVSVEIPSTTVLHIPRKVSLFLLFWSVPSLLVLRLPLLLRSEILKTKYFLYSMFYFVPCMWNCNWRTQRQRGLTKIRLSWDALYFSDTIKALLPAMYQATCFERDQF